MGRDGPLYVVTSGLYVRQSPGSESVGGYCFLVQPSGPRQLGLLEHPVDSRPSAFEKARELALADLPPGAELGPLPPPSDPDWMWRPAASPFVAPAALWSRVRRAPHFEVVMEWEAGDSEPRVTGSSRDRDVQLAWMQAEWVARYLTSTT